MKLMLFVSLFFASALAMAAPTRVAFLEYLDRNGQPIVLEPGGRFAHVAISYGGGWLQAHPYGGVRIVGETELRRMGHVAMILDLPVGIQIPDAAVRYFLGRPYDPHFSWNDEGIYCSELIAKLLGVPPRTMDFSADYWRNYPYEIRDTVGVSPDGLYRALLQFH